jgi:hypothetical protein
MNGYLKVVWFVSALCVVGTCVGVAGAARAAGGDDGDGAKGADDRSTLQGTWTCVSAVVDGKPLSAKVAGELRLTLTADRYRTERGDEVLFDSTYRLARRRRQSRSRWSARKATPRRRWRRGYTPSRGTC